ncbi:MAG TPA: PAC2 family protein [Phycisphaerales bacterium]|nr:PAC2 family protein [Phycisphaerales bacterium]
MSEPTNTPRRPYLLAAWPGMGNVAVIAAGYLARKLGMEPAGAIPLIDTFDLNHIDVSSGVVERPHLPRGLLFRTPADYPGRPVILFLGEAQPSRQGYAFVHGLLDRLRDQNVERVITFASLASQVHPTEPSRVTAAVTTKNLLGDFAAHGVNPTSDGQIGGLNGLMLGAAAEREIDGACLLAEIPFYAMNVPNYKAARSVLGVFCDLAEIELEFAELDHHAEVGERALVRMLEKLQKAHGEDSGDDEQDYSESLEEPEEPRQSAGPAGRDTGRTSRLTPGARARIEQLFKEAEANRQLAFELKSELDRLGVFSEYEDRFLDLFRRAE